MNISYEFILKNPLEICIGTFFESSLYHCGKYVNRSFGSDNFHVNTTIPLGFRVSGSGRNCVIQVSFEDLPEKIQSQQPNLILIDSTSQLEILCKTNIFLLKQDFCSNLDIVITVNEQTKVLSLVENINSVQFISDGRFLINLSDFLVDKL